MEGQEKVRRKIINQEKSVTGNVREKKGGGKMEDTSPVEVVVRKGFKELGGNDPDQSTGGRG